LCEKGNFRTGTAKGWKFSPEVSEIASAYVESLAER
jgi:hypothetical protein